MENKLTNLKPYFYATLLGLAVPIITGLFPLFMIFIFVCEFIDFSFKTKIIEKLNIPYYFEKKDYPELSLLSLLIIIVILIWGVLYG